MIKEDTLEAKKRKTTLLLETRSMFVFRASPGSYLYHSKFTEKSFCISDTQIHDLKRAHTAQD